MATYVQKGDIILDEDNIPLIVNGDFVTTEDATKQNIKNAIQSVYGDLIESPQLAANVSEIINEDEFLGYAGKVQKVLEADGMDVETCSLSTGPKLTVVAGYKN